jgi:predicted glycogen debranching enzyme
MIRIDQSVCQDVDQARKLEWLETNGLGGFSSSSILCLNTRRYHGLLTAATKPPVGRLVLLSKIEETLVIDGRPFDFSANQYPGAVHPQGQHYLKEFRLDPFPTFVYDVEGVEIEKRVFMVQGENTTIVEYNIHSPGGTSDCVLELRPLIAFRDYHGTTHQNGSLNPAVRSANGVASIAPYDGLPELHFGHNADALDVTGNWYLNFEYAAEQERGLDAHEDLFNPFVLRFPAPHGTTATVIASTQVRPAARAPELREQEIERRNGIIQRAPSTNPLIQRLTAAADQFIVQRGDLNTIIAGYHWFADWGRDTMIALPGITLTTGRPDVARNILEAFAQSADQGMLPNRFPDAGESPEYNTVDATLWFFEAVRSYLQYTGDYDFVRTRLYSKLKEIIDWHIRGTRYGIHLDSDGLLACGEAGVQLTWMDAKIGDWVVTPRTGKPVEIQALWYNALCILPDVAHEFGGCGNAQLADANVQSMILRNWERMFHSVAAAKASRLAESLFRVLVLDLCLAFSFAR